MPGQGVQGDAQKVRERKELGGGLESGWTLWLRIVMVLLFVTVVGSDS